MTFTEYERLLNYLGNKHTDQFIKYQYSLVRGELKIEKERIALISEEKHQEFLMAIDKWKIDNSLL